MRLVPRRLSDQIVGPLVLVVSLASLAFFAREYLITRNSLLGLLDREGDLLVEHIDASANALSHGNGDEAEELQRLVENAGLRSDVCQLLLIGADGLALAASERTAVGKTAQELLHTPKTRTRVQRVRETGEAFQQFLRESNGRRHHVTVLPYRDARPGASSQSGAIVVVLNADDVAHELTGSILRHAIASVITTAAVVLVAWLVLHVLALRPLAGIVHALGDAGESKRFRMPVWLPQNELGQLARTLERDFNRLEDSRREVQRLALVVAHTDTIIAVTDRRGVIQWANAAFIEATGASCCLELPVSIHDYFPSPEIAALLRDAKAGAASAVRGELTIERRNAGEDHRTYAFECKPIQSDQHEAAPSDEPPRSFMIVATDITEHRRLETQLRSAAERLELATRGARIGVWEWDIARDHLAWDDQMFELFGVDRAEFVPAYTTWKERVHHDDVDAAERHFVSLIDGAGEFNCEFRIVTPTGETRHIHGAASLIRTPDGRAERVIGVNLDVSAQRIAEQTALDQRAELQTILDALPAFVCFKDANNTILRINSTGADWLGGRPWEIEGHSMDEFASTELAARYFADDLEVLDSGQPKLGIVEPLVSADGTHRLIRVDKIPLRAQTNDIRRLVVVATDITEQREAEERLELALRSANQGLWDWNLETGEVVFNDIWFTMLGYRPDELPESLDTWKRLCHPDDLPRCERAIADHFAGRAHTYRCEHRLMGKDGRYRWILDVGEITTRSESGDPLRMVGVHIDIDALKQTAEQRAANERRFRALFERSPIGIALNDLETGAFLDVNDALLKPTGYTRDEFLTLSYWDVTPEEYAAREAEQIGTLERTGQYGPYAKEYIKKDGSRYPVVLQGARVEEAEGGARIWSFIEDVTERRAAEDVLRHRTALLGGLLDSIPDLVFFKDLDGVYLGCNPAFSAFVARPRERIVGGTDFELFPADVARSFREYDAAMLNDGKPQLNEEWVDHPEHGRILLATLKAPLIDPDGAQIGLLGVSRDITEREMVRVRLDDSRAAAEAASTAKSEFLANMSHEIRTPMTAILGFADLLLDPELNDEQRRTHIGTIRRNGEHLLSVINDILDLSKIEAGKLEVESLEADPIAITHEAVELLRVRADAKGVALDVDVVSHAEDGLLPGAVLTDPIRLRQVLVNLLGNAVKFTEDGGVRLTLSYVPQTPDGDATLRFDVADTGIGMSKAQLAKLFNAFAQADSSTTRRFGGTGLGLNISKRLANMLGGDIAVTSTPGRGSTFTVTIPVRLADGVAFVDPSRRDDRSRIARAATPSATDPAKALGDVRILLAEDGPDNQRLISFHLRKAGADVTIAANGQIAVDALADQPDGFDLVLMDMQMPELDGYSATRRLRERGCSLPIVALTAHAMEGDRDKCIAAGCDDYHTKPIEREALIALCARLIAARRRSAA